MSRLTRKPRLFGSNTQRVAGASAVLLALASQLAAAQDVAADAAPPTSSDTPHAAATAAPSSLQKATSPLGWTAAGVLLALALCPPRLIRTTEDA